MSRSILYVYKQMDISVFLKVYEHGYEREHKHEIKHEYVHVHELKYYHCEAPKDWETLEYVQISL